jgi:hypothetical protein
MARQNLRRGAAANDGTGDTLRQAGLKINQNFSELYSKLGAGVDSANNLSTVMGFDSSALTFDSASYTVSLMAATPTANRTIKLPDASDTLVGKATTDTLTNKTLTSPVLTTPQINDTSADHQYVFAVSELAADRTVTLPLLSGADTFVFQAHGQTLTNKTLTSPTLNTAKIGTSLNDTNANELIKVTATGSAVNEFTVANAATGSGPTLSATGGDTNVNININAKGTGSVEIGKLAVNHDEITAASGTASTSTSLTILNRGSAIALTISDGITIGEVKHLLNINTGTVTATPDTFGQGTSFTLAADKGCTMLWHTNGWYVLNQNEVTIT